MRPRFEIRPLGPWGRPVTADRQSSRRFRAPWPSTIALLQREVAALDGDLIVIQVDAKNDEIRRDGMLRARAAVGSPAVKVWFASKHGPLTYATDVYDHWQANVRAVALALEALRAVDRYGVTGSGEQYRGWTAIGATPAESGMTPEAALRVLSDAAGVAPSPGLPDAAAVTAMYRVAVREHHPDAGGRPEAFRLITTARDVLMGATRA